MPTWYPKVGDHLFLVKHGEEIPFIVIDVLERKVALQATVKGDHMFDVVILSWDSRWGWHWRESIYDDNPWIAVFREA